MTEKYKTNNLELNTKKKLFNKAVSYLAKFETTTGKLKLILEKFASNNLTGVSQKIISKNFFVYQILHKSHSF